MCNKVVCDDKEVSGQRSGQERTTEKQEPNAKTWAKSLCFAPRHLPQNKSQTTFIQPFHRDSSHRFHKTIVVRDTSTRHNACTRHDPTVHWATPNYITPLQIRFSTFFDTTKRLSGRTQRLVRHFPSRSFTFFHSLEHVTM